MSDKTPGELIAEKLVRRDKYNAFGIVIGEVLVTIGDRNGFASEPKIKKAIATAFDQAIAAEREACAKLVEQDPNSCATCGLSTPDYRAKYLAEAIRARG